MKNKGILALLGGVAASSLLVASAGAFPLTVNSYVAYGSGTLPVDGSPHAFEFTISGTDFDGNYAPQAQPSWLVPNRGLTGFQTFCVEKSEGSTDATIGFLNTGAVAGGVSGGNPDPISRATAWLYSQFGHGVLAGYDYNTIAGRDDSAAALGQAIWFLEGEIATPFNGAGFVALAMSSITNPLDDANGALGVKVINMYKTDGTIRQDMLVLVPDGGATLLLLGMALSGFALVSRRRLAK